MASQLSLIPHGSPAASTSTGYISAQNTSVIHAVHPDVWVVEKASTNFWNTQAPTLGAITCVFIASILKWRYDLLERRYQLKRALYLDVADAIFKVSQVIYMFEDPKNSIGDLNAQFNSSMLKLSQASLVASDKLLTELTAFQAIAQKALSEVYARRVDLEEKIAELESYQEIIDDIQENIKAERKEGTKLKIDGLQGTKKFETLISKSKHSIDLLQKYGDNEKARNEEADEIVRDLRRIATINRSAMFPASIKIVQIMRSDLGFRFDQSLHFESQIKNFEQQQADLVGASHRVAHRYVDW